MPFLKKKMQISAIIGCILLCGRVFAADCPSGQFCVWEQSDFKGQRFNWGGDDGMWESWIADEDSSWANHGVSGPGIKDHVQIYSGAHQGGDMTLCLGPGDEISSNAVANDRGNSHVWAYSCTRGDY